MRKYRINRSVDGGGIKVDGSPTPVEAVKGILIYHTEETQCNPFNSQYGEDIWVAISFIDLTFGEPDWAFALFNKGKSNALEGFNNYLIRVEPFNNVFTLRLTNAQSRDQSKRWYTYYFSEEPLTLKILDLLTQTLNKNASLPLIDPYIAGSFPEPPSLSSIIETIKVKETEKLKLIQQIQISEEIEREVQGNIDPEIWGGMIW